MANLLNASPDFTNPFIAKTDIVWLPSNSSLQEEGTTGKPVNKLDFVRVVNSWPESAVVGVNYEPADGIWEYLKYWKHPDEAVALRENLANDIHRLRPDITLIFYTVPGLVDGIKSDPANARIYIDRELAFRNINVEPAISGYMNPNESIEEWEREQDFSIAMAHSIHGKKPYAFVWDGASYWYGQKGWAKSLTYTQMSHILRYFRKRDITCIYWSPWSEAYRGPVPKSTQAALWEHTLL